MSVAGQRFWDLTIIMELPRQQRDRFQSRISDGAKTLEEAHTPGILANPNFLILPTMANFASALKPTIKRKDCPRFICKLELSNEMLTCNVRLLKACRMASLKELIIRCGYDFWNDSIGRRRIVCGMSDARQWSNFPTVSKLGLPTLEEAETLWGRRVTIFPRLQKVTIDRKQIPTYHVERRAITLGRRSAFLLHDPDINRSFKMHDDDMLEVVRAAITDRANATSGHSKTPTGLKYVP